MVNYKGYRWMPLLKELPDKPPTLKPIVSTVSWLDELHQVNCAKMQLKKVKAILWKRRNNTHHKKICHKVAQIQATQHYTKFLLWEYRQLREGCNLSKHRAHFR